MSNSVSSSDRFPQLEKYELAEEIGHGGMATVYRARDVRLEREVAVKLIHKHLRENPEVRRRFVAEAKAVAKLRHPAIVDVYDVSDDAELERYLVVELIRGKSLRQVLQDHVVLPAEIAACIAALLCDAVEHAHQHGVIHRDIKPENVLIELSQDRPSDAVIAEQAPEGDRLSGETLPRRRSERPSSGTPAVIVKLTDFGIAKVLDVQGVTSTGQILGSPAHMAPEQIEGGNVGPHTDVFALGVLMYEAMVGHLPFEGKNPAQVLRRVLEGDFEVADAERPEVGGRWARIVARTLQVDAAARPATAAELGGLIDAELAALGIDDIRGELARYFEDPAAYREAQREELVERILRRGERDRRRGMVQGAAADFNRALAMRPDDLAILKRVSTLSAQAAWRQRAIWLAGILVGSSALLGAAYGLTRLFKSDGAIEASARPSVPVPQVDLKAPSGAMPSPPPSAMASATADPTARERVVSPSGPSPSASAESGNMRRMRFHINPVRDADDSKLSLDGTEVAWFNAQHELEVGSKHQLRAWVAGDCCEEKRMSITVQPAPDGDPGRVEVITLHLPIKKATAKLVGGPPNALVSCAENGLMVSKGGSIEVPMTAPTWSNECTFTPGDKKGSVSLRAGRENIIRWPD